jgi:hypothetical protein
MVASPIHPRAQTAVFIAACNGNKSVLEALLAGKADPSTVKDTPNGLCHC